MRRRFVALFLVAVATIAGIVVGAPIASATTNPIFAVMNTSESLPDGVYFRNSAHTADTDGVTGHGVYKGDKVRLGCYSWGDPVKPYANTLWYKAVNMTRPTVAGHSNVGYLNAHFINDGKSTNQVDAGVPPCSSAPKVTPCLLNVRWNHLNISINYGGNHRYYGNAWQAAADWSNLQTGVTVSMNQTNTTMNITLVDVYSTVGVYASTQWQSLLGANPKGSPSVPTSPKTPSYVEIWVNQYMMDRLDDPHRTYAIEHEIGHALGLAHSTDCGITSSSIMPAGDDAVPQRTVLKPTRFDMLELEELYKLPTG